MRGGSGGEGIKGRALRGRGGAPGRAVMLQIGGGGGGAGLAEIARDDVEGEVDAGGEAAGARRVAVVDEADAAPQLHAGIGAGELVPISVVGGGR